MNKLHTILAFLALSLSAMAQSDIIATQPEGTLYHNLYGQRAGYYNYWYNYFSGSTDGAAEDVVVATDGTVYLKNPVSFYPTGTWIKGTPATGDTICFQFPQTVYTEVVSGQTYNYAIYRMTKQGSTWAVDPDTQTVKFVWHDGSLVKTEQTSLLGLCFEDGSSWTYYGDYDISITPIQDQTVAPARPEDAQTYLMTYTDDSDTEAKRVVRLAIEDNDVYLGAFAENQPGAWTKGALQTDGSVSFATAVYLGVDTIDGVHTWFTPDRLTFANDTATGNYTTDGTFTVDEGRNSSYTKETFTAATLQPYTVVEGQPDKPVITDYMVYGEIGDYAGIRFTLPTSTADGGYLDPSRMFYRIYFNGEAVTLQPDEYVRLTEPMTDIPYNYDDGYDIRVSGDLHTFYFYRSDLETIGVASFYRGDSMTWPSTMVYLNLKAITDGIDGIATDGNATVTYTDLSGRTVSQPRQGLYLKTTVQPDGTRETRKIVVGK